MISFIVPAHNEEAWVGRCVSAIRNGMESLTETYEIIVVDDTSSDATASIARQHGAQVIRVEHRQIAATRNVGAQQAHGDILFFVDADTLANAAAIQAALRAIRAGAIGGGWTRRCGLASHSESIARWNDCERSSGMQCCSAYF